MREMYQKNFNYKLPSGDLPESERIFTNSTEKILDIWNNLKVEGQGITERTFKDSCQIYNKHIKSLFKVNKSIMSSTRITSKGRNSTTQFPREWFESFILPVMSKTERTVDKRSKQHYVLKTQFFYLEDLLKTFGKNNLRYPLVTGSRVIVGPKAIWKPNDREIWILPIAERGNDCIIYLTGEEKYGYCRLRREVMIV
eukprot:TRINITY_DN24676_c0_g1_i1.p1 TRINITY_DN24676_c0_g1~~TRINITY_DN24676_c0_g1_i1.p1  ORF type:complete len:198 (-),score=18.54 TRINITY_DN24676_c0_g1_i1:40-633(-)